MLSVHSSMSDIVQPHGMYSIRESWHVINSSYMKKHVDISIMFQKADDAIFSAILSNKSHLLYTYLYEWPEIAYSLRTRNYNKFLIPKTNNLGDRHFISRMLYKNLYRCDLTNQTYMSLTLSPSCHHCILLYV